MSGGSMNKKLQFNFGALADPISKQYERQGYKLKNAEVIEC